LESTIARGSGFSGLLRFTDINDADAGSTN